MIDLDALQSAYSLGASGAIMRLMPAIIAELREARTLVAKLPHHCGSQWCGRRVEPDSVLCDCPCDKCTAAESMGIYAHEATP